MMLRALLGVGECKLMVGFGIELRIGQHQAEGRTCSGHIQQPGQRRGVATRSGMGPLRQPKSVCCKSATTSHFNQRRWGALPCACCFDAAEEEGADGVLRQPRAVHAGRVTRAERRPRRNWRTVSSSPRSMVSSSSRFRKRYKVV